MRAGIGEEKRKMTNAVKRRRKAVVDANACVACGCCAKVCPMQAVEIVRGVMAHIRLEKCVGCGRCVRECPVSVIALEETDA